MTRYVVFVAMLMSIVAIRRRGLQAAFLDVWMPFFLVMPFGFWVDIPGLPDPNFMQAAILPILFVLLRERLGQMNFGRMEFLLVCYVVVRVVADFLGRGYSDAQNYAFYMLSSLIGPYLLGRYLIDNFVVNMPTFRGKSGLKAARFLPLTAARTTGDPRSRHVETVESGDLVAEMAWDALGEPFAVEVNPEQSATGTHQMYSIFIEAKAASVTLDGTALSGQVASRQLFGRTISTAFLAFSETWVRPAA